MYRAMLRWTVRVALAVGMGIGGGWVRAGQIFVTAPGTTTGGGPVAAEADFTTGASTITVTLKNLLSNPTDVAQNLSALTFKTSTAPGGPLSLSSSTGTLYSIDKQGAYTSSSLLANQAGWVLSNPSDSVLSLNVLVGTGHAGPTHTIIGGPASGGTYASANSSIAGNKPHSPFIALSETWQITAPGITANTQISNVVFQFGTADGENHVQGVPAPSSLVGLAGMGAAGAAIFARRRMRTPKG